MCIKSATHLGAPERLLLSSSPRNFLRMISFSKSMVSSSPCSQTSWRKRLISKLVNSINSQSHLMCDPRSASWVDFNAVDAAAAIELVSLLPLPSTPNPAGVTDYALWRPPPTRGRLPGQLLQANQERHNTRRACLPQLGCRGSPLPLGLLPWIAATWRENTALTEDALVRRLRPIKRLWEK